MFHRFGTSTLAGLAFLAVVGGTAGCGTGADTAGGSTSSSTSSASAAPSSESPSSPSAEPTAAPCDRLSDADVSRLTVGGTFEHSAFDAGECNWSRADGTYTVTAIVNLSETQFTDACAKAPAVAGIGDQACFSPITGDDSPAIWVKIGDRFLYVSEVAAGDVAPSTAPSAALEQVTKAFAAKS